MSNTSRLFDDTNVSWSVIHHPETGHISLFPNPPSTSVNVQLLISVRGACEEKGYPYAVASYGVFFRRNSPYNRSSLLPRGIPQTNQSADLFAVLSAIHLVTKELTTLPGSLKDIVIQTDSLYVVKSLTEYIWTWQKNDYRNAGGHFIANYELFTEIQTLLAQAKQQHGIIIKFSHVLREQNQDADHLACIALEMQDMYQYCIEPVMMPNVEWSYASKFDSILWTPTDAVYVARVFCRLDAPLFQNRENTWASSIISWFIRHKLNYSKEVPPAPFETALSVTLGELWRDFVGTERIKIIEDMLEKEDELKKIPWRSDRARLDEWIGCLQKLAQLGKILSRIAKYDLAG